MITQTEADGINTAALLLPRRGVSEPPAIELGDALVHAYIRRNGAGCAVVALDLNTGGVDRSSVLASPVGVLFEVRVNYALVADGSVSLDKGLPVLDRVEAVAR